MEGHTQEQPRHHCIEVDIMSEGENKKGDFKNPVRHGLEDSYGEPYIATLADGAYVSIVTYERLLAAYVRVKAKRDQENAPCVTISFCVNGATITATLPEEEEEKLTTALNKGPN